MALIQSRSPAEQLLLLIQQAYQTPHIDSSDEQRENQQLVEQALRQGVSEQQFVTKAAALARLHGSMRYKLNTLIAGRYWEQSIQQPLVTARGYTPPGPRASSEPFSLEP